MPTSELDSPPTKERIRELYAHIWERDPGWGRQRALDKRLIDMYFDEHSIEVPDTANEERKRQLEPVRMATGEAARIVDLITSFYIQPPRMGVHNVGITAKDPGAGENVALAINEAIDQLNPATDSPWRTGLYGQVLLGRSVDLIAKGSDYWYDSYPYKEQGESERAAAKRRDEWRRKAPLPILWTSLPPESTFPANLSTVDDEVLSTKVVSWSDIFDMFSEEEIGKSGAEVPERDSNEWFSSVLLGIYSNRHSIAYMILAEQKTGPMRIGGHGVGGVFPDAIIRNVEHGLNRCAIRILPGAVTGRKEPPYYWRSVLYPVMGLLEEIDKLASRAATSAKFDAFPLMKEHINELAVETEGDGTRGDVKKFFEGDILTYNAGNAQTGEGREDIQPVFQPEHGEQTRELLIWALDRAGQITGASPALEGVITANTAAWSHSWSSEMSKRKQSGLTTAVIARSIDVSESLIAATVAFDEKIPLAKPEGETTIVLDPKKLEGWRLSIAGSYEPKLPSNLRADMDAAMSLLEKSAEFGVPSPIWILEKFGNIDNFWQHVQEGMEVRIVLDAKMQETRMKIMRDRLDADIQEDEGMGLDELEASGLPEDIKELMRQRLQEPPGRNGGPVRGSPESAGLMRAATPFSTEGTGPQPEETIR